MPSQLRPAARRPSRGFVPPGNATSRLEPPAPCEHDSSQFLGLVLNVNVLLDAHAVDLKQVVAAVRSDASLTQGIIGFSPLLAESPHLAGGSLEEATVLLGSERFRLAMLSAALLDYQGRCFAVAPRDAELRHSLMSAFACERLARWAAFHDVELAYLIGLLHWLSPAATSDCRENRGSAYTATSWVSRPSMAQHSPAPACVNQDPDSLAPGGRVLAALGCGQRRRREASETALLGHLVDASCSLARACSITVCAAVPISRTVVQQMIADALAPYFPRVRVSELARLSLDIQVALEPLVVYLDSSNLGPDSQQEALAPIESGDWRA